MSLAIEVEPTTKTPLKRQLITWIGLALGVYCILLAVGMVGGGFKWASGGKEGAERLFAFATNPFLGLLIGTMATALVQSSSTVTSVIVGLVAGGLPVSTAIPMIMGANIGTTITNTLVSLGHIREKAEFERAFSAATIHDFFNILCVVIFLPLEMAFGFLEKIGGTLATLITSGSIFSGNSVNFVKLTTKPVIGSFKGFLEMLPEPFGGLALICLGIGLIFISITVIGRLLRSALVGRAKKILHVALARGPLTSIFSGTAVTVLVQSSSTTTSLAVPLAGSGVFTPKEIYPFTLGANIGTCITAVLAATAISGPAAVLAMQIAMIHLVYNVFGVAVIYGLPALRELPLKWANQLALVASERKAVALAYVVAIFFLIPGIATAVSAVL